MVGAAPMVRGDEIEIESEEMLPEFKDIEFGSDTMRSFDNKIKT
jgi:hypothetical protein